MKVGISTPILVFVISIANLIVGRLIVGGKRRKVSETDGEIIQVWGLAVIAVIGLGSMFVLDISDPQIMKWFWLGFVTLTVGIQAFLDWKFLKETKEYVVSLIVLLIGLIYIYIFMFYF